MDCDMLNEVRLPAGGQEGLYRVKLRLAAKFFFFLIDLVGFVNNNPSLLSVDTAVVLSSQSAISPEDTQLGCGELNR